MHHSSRLKFECFVETYMKQDGNSALRTVLDVGSRQVSENAFSYRQALEGLNIDYKGLDLEAGFNVNIVPANPFIWNEIEDETFDFVISGQAFEHNPFMWITTAEIARVLKPGGIAFIIAPSSGGVHRFPFDCWRYYPDSWAALAAVTDLELTESIREPEKFAETVNGGRWKDSAAIMRKRPFASDEEKESFYANLALVVAPFKVRRYEVIPAILNNGPCFARYVEAVSASGAEMQRPGAKGNARRKARLAAAAQNATPVKLSPAQEKLRAERRAARRKALQSQPQ